MKIEDYHAKISLFYETNPHLTHDELAVVLTADLMYKDLPDDLPEFRKRYAHLDPSVLEGAHEGITFLRIAEDKKPPSRPQGPAECLPECEVPRHHEHQGL